MLEGPHLDALREALRAEADAQRRLQAGDDGAAAEFAAAAAGYRRSWELAPPGSFGRLIGMLKAAILGGDAQADARYVIEQLGDEPESPASAYALALARLSLGNDAAARSAAASMGDGGSAFGRAAAAIDALTRGDTTAYATAIEAIVADFSSREDHLTGVRIADTALMFDRLAAARGLEPHAPLTLPTP